MAKSKTVYVCQNCGAESPKWMGRCNACDQWNTYVEQRIPQGPVRSFTRDKGAYSVPKNLDEVQNISGWEKWVLKEYSLKESQLYVTGSSSSLLSRDIGTALTGRYLDIAVLPLSFEEFLRL